MDVLTAYTNEVDDVAVAVTELLEQLDLEANLCKNSVGIITCYAEYIDTGVVETLCAAFPFDVIGCTTVSNSVSGALGFNMLGITVLTADDVQFSAVLSDDLNEQAAQGIEAAAAQALAGVPAAPGLVLVKMPLMNQVSGEHMLEVLDKAVDGAPIFGTLATDHTENYRYAQTIFNGQAYRSRMALVCMSGNVNPRFSIYAVPKENAVTKKAIITKAQDNCLMAVNEKPFLEYMATLGISIEDGSIGGIDAIPLMIDYNDGTQPVCRVAIMVNEEGYAICGGKMPEGATIMVYTLVLNDIVAAGKKYVAEMKDIQNKNGILAYTCISRTLLLGLDAEAELAVIQAGLKDEIPYMIAYASGEICPTCDEGGTMTNRLHNYSLISCCF
jgi:FIST N domain./FIST C domain.